MSDDIEAWLRGVYRPQGRRLGVITVGDVGERIDRLVDAFIAEADMLPDRRHARLLPRIGEQAHRVDDLAEYAAAYGHEYQAAVIVASSLDDPALAHDVMSACEREGVAVRTI